MTASGRAARILRRVRPPVSRRRRGAADRLVTAAYREILGRDPDPGGAATYGELVARGRLDADSLAATLRRSPEYLLGRTGFYERLHRSRMAWCATLPAWDTVLDIGGSSPTCELGALVELGYPHTPREIHVVDLPEDQQFHGRPAYDQSVERRRGDLTVTFHHADAARLDDLADLAGRRFDAVVMGQVIEHIPVEALPGVLAAVRRHLTPEGVFVFDTPNRALTRLVMGDALLTADHTHEYTPDEMVGVLAAHGFTVDEVVGIHPLPDSVARGEFDPHEEADPPVVADPTACFCFAVTARPD
ncbi:MAG: methyltransferase domain-containing protein [Actinomyces sp.]|nr:MAG: methyltransferase domain-containing protein [Actinomyces sp.]